MELRECLLLLPGHGLDDFPRSLPKLEANELLAGWIALWHPQFIAATKTAPRWQSASYPPNDLKGVLLVESTGCQSLLPTSFAQQVTEAGAMLCKPTSATASNSPPGHEMWQLFQAELLESLGPFHQTATTQQLLPDFAALGYAFLQIQLMTRQLRYTSNLDELLFNDQLLQAAKAAIADDLSTAERMLQSCFDQLGQERDHYYSLEVHLIDVTLLANSTLGTSLAKQLDAPNIPTSMVASASLLRRLQSKAPDNYRKLVDALSQRACCLVGGLDHERPHPLMSPEALQRDLRRGRQAHADLGLDLPKVFTRYSYGMLPEMPLYLKRAGFSGAMLIAWERGSYPEGNQAKISWESSDGVYLSTLAPRILDAADPACFLNLGVRAGEALDREQAPALVLAHWPGRECAYYRLLQRIAKRTPALGKFVLVDDFFDNTDQPYHQDRLSAGQFCVDWLPSDQPGLGVRMLARTRAYQQCHARANAAQNLANMLYQLEHFHQATSLTTTASGPEAESQPATYSAPTLNSWAPELAALWDQIDALWETEVDDLGHVQSCLSQLKTLNQQQLTGLAGRLGKSQAKPMDPSPSNTGLLVVNPRSCPTRYPIRHSPSHSYGDKSTWKFAEGSLGKERVALVDVPAFGFVLSPLSPAPSGKEPKQRALVDASGMMQNEFLEVQIDPARGLLSSLHVPGKRGNRMSFSVARRTRKQRDVRYSEMRCDRLNVLTNSPMLGQLRATGKIVDNQLVTGEFEIDYSLWRASRLIEIELRLQVAAAPGEDPWLSADVLRFAWPTESAIVRSFATGARDSVAGGQFVAPAWIEIDETDYRTHLLLGGLGFHRRVENRFLETLVAVAGQREAEARLAIGVDLPFPLQAAEQFCDEPHVSHLQTVAPENQSGWLFNVDAKNTKLDLECPLLNVDQRLVGQRLRCLETIGKVTTANLRFLREVLDAYRVDDFGNRLGKLTVSGDSVTISLRGNERVLIDVLWK